jgi:hypothetical protein
MPNAITHQNSMYYSDAAEFYETHFDSEYEHCHNNHYRFFMIMEYSEWLHEMNEVIRIWE